MKRDNFKIKRGLLELDLILSPFYKNAYKYLDSNSKNSFDKLLQMDDIKLLKLIFKPESSSSKELRSLLKLIKNYPNTSKGLYCEKK
tara:strand:- start:430 stop:690 length:261 start_codon:yes stop_codon:yes gene_type:complete